MQLPIVLLAFTNGRADADLYSKSWNKPGTIRPKVREMFKNQTQAFPTHLKFTAKHFRQKSNLSNIWGFFTLNCSIKMFHSSKSRMLQQHRSFEFHWQRFVAGKSLRMNFIHLQWFLISSKARWLWLEQHLQTFRMIATMTAGVDEMNLRYKSSGTLRIKLRAAGWEAQT